jgi:hypothetical protein
MAPSIIYLPTMALTMVRRVTAKLPYNHFLFRCVREQRHYLRGAGVSRLTPRPPPVLSPFLNSQSPKHTKSEIREYLEKVYNVKVARVTTSITLGA